MLEEYRARRDFLVAGLRDVGFTTYVPAGAFYTMAGFDRFGYAQDVSFANHLVKDVGLGVVPGNSFFAVPEEGRHLVRFAFPKQMSTLARAMKLLERLEPAGSSL